ncbi:hypothetical protein ACJMK2_026980 [Sinanodonta woodiana]|uniref:Tetraspanin n=1 Tax=Sinanodonta woodiana TaxID=1069815 RepID=A0ABD3XLF4_SINWO
MGAFEGGGRFILVLINGLLSLVGIALLIIGCIAKWGEQLTDQYLSEIYKTFQSAASSINPNVDVSNFNIADVLNDVFIALIVLGGFFLLFGIFGCIGATCRVKVALIVYSGVLIFIIVAELVCVILLFTIREKIDSWLKDPMKRQLREKYSGFNGTDTVTLTWNLLMTNLQCCGVDSYKDFEHSTRFNRTDNTGTIFPEACCPDKSNEVCIYTSRNTYANKSCYAAAEAWLNGHMDIVIGSLSGLGGLEVILLVFSCLTFCASRRSKKSEDEQDFSNELEHKQPPMNREYVNDSRANINYGYAFENPPAQRNQAPMYDRPIGMNQRYEHAGPARMNPNQAYERPYRQYPRY